MKKLLILIPLLLINGCSPPLYQPIDTQNIKYLKQNFPAEYKLLQQNKIKIDSIQPDINYIKYHYI